MGILGWIVFGLIVGAVAKFVMPGRDPGGIIVTMLIGVVGSLLGGFLGRSLGLYGAEQTGAGFLMSLLGAVVLLFLYRMVAGRRHITT
ncbi:MAG: GlsB/YeaQ/YmgE family stress response membrane protein [Acidobacteriota bacterium]